MYPISLGSTEAERRIKALMTNGHHAEALVTAVFTFEKTLRRSLRFMAVSRGFTSTQSEVLFGRMGFNDLKTIWPCFDKSHSTLVDFVGQKLWQHVANAVTMRNKLVHGERVYRLADCKTQAEQVLDALEALQTKLKAEIGFNGWSRLPVRKKAMLAWLGPTSRSNRSRVKRTPV